MISRISRKKDKPGPEPSKECPGPGLSTRLLEFRLQAVFGRPAEGGTPTPEAGWFALFGAAVVGIGSGGGSSSSLPTPAARGRGFRLRRRLFHRPGSFGGRCLAHG